jgi:hypothetical protein
MKDNLLFFGVPEGRLQIPCPESELSTELSTETTETIVDTNGINNCHENMNTNSEEQQMNNLPLNLTQMNTENQEQYSAVAATDNENCKNKVYDFCKKVLKMKSPEQNIKIVVAHRIGRFVPGKIRPIVARLEPESKAMIKKALKSVKLKETPYNVSDQFPQEVKDKRKALIPDLVKARQEGKTAFIRRDKLVILPNRGSFNTASHEFD